jgi:hypothetical protein
MNQQAFKKYKKISSKNLIDVFSEDQRLEYYRWAESSVGKLPQPVYWLFMPISYLVNIVDEVPMIYRDYIRSVKRLRDRLGLSDLDSDSDSDLDLE